MPKALKVCMLFSGLRTVCSVKSVFVSSEPFCHVDGACSVVESICTCLSWLSVWLMNLTYHFVTIHNGQAGISAYP